MREIDQPAVDDELDLRDYLAVIKRRKYLIILTVVLVVGLALVLSFLQTPRYRSTAEVLLQPRASEQILVPDQGGQQDQARTIVDTEIEVMRSRSVEGAVRDALGFSPDVSISSRGETYVVAISATSTEPREATRIANTYATTYVDTRREAQVEDLLDASEQIQGQLLELDDETEALDGELVELDTRIASAPDEDGASILRAERDRLVTEQQADRASIANRRATYLDQLDQLRLSSGLTKTGGAQIVSQAEPAGAPFEPTPERNAAVALVLGLLLGVGLAFLRDHLDDRITSREDLDRVIPTVGLLSLVPQYPDWRDQHVATLASVTAPQSSTAEAYRTLRTSLAFVGLDHSITVTQITSPNPGEGKSTTLANLGVQLSRAGKRVVLVDCDLRRPRLHHFFGLENSVGFTSVMLKEAELEDSIQVVEGERNLMVVTSGPVPPNPSELLSTKRARDVLHSLAEEADYVLVDSPPVLPVSDALVLSGIVDATILVISTGATTKREAHRAFEQLDQIDAPIIGAVLNSVDASATYDRSYGGSYAYLYGTEPEDRPRRRRRRRRPWRKRPTPDPQPEPSEVAAS